MRLNSKSKYNTFIVRKYKITDNILTLDRILNARVTMWGFKDFEGQGAKGENVLP